MLLDFICVEDEGNFLRVVKDFSKIVFWFVGFVLMKIIFFVDCFKCNCSIKCIKYIVF